MKQLLSKNLTPLVPTSHLSILLLVVLVSSCASSYRNIRPEAFRNYATDAKPDGTTISYKYNVLSATGNKKYAKRETKRGVDLIAIRVTNNSDRALNFKKDIRIVANGNVVLPIEPEVVQKMLKQLSWPYIFYVFGYVYFNKCTNGDCDQTYIPIGIPIAAGNLIMASSANKKFREELQLYNILDKTISPGETMDGLVGIKSQGYAPLNFEIVE